MKKLKENKPLRFALGAFLLLLLCLNLPNLLFFPLCIKEDIFRPPNTEVLVSACKKPGARGVPGGEVLFVREGLIDKAYLLDLRTGEKKNIPIDPLFGDHGVFLSPDLVWLEGSLVYPNNPSYRPHYILDLTDGRRYELLDLDLLPRLEGGKFDPNNYAYIQNSDRVYIHHTENTLIAISSDFRTNPNSRVIFSGYSIGIEHGIGLETLAKDMGMYFEIIDFSLNYAGVPSPTGKYIVRHDGIYLIQTNKAVYRRAMGWHFKSWYYDESGIVLQESGWDLISLPEVRDLYPIPVPLLKLKIPAP